MIIRWLQKNTFILENWPSSIVDNDDDRDDDDDNQW